MATDEIKVKIGFFGTRGIPSNYGGFETIAEMVSEGIDGERFIVIVSEENRKVKEPVMEGYVGRKIQKLKFPASKMYSVNSWAGNVFTEASMIRWAKQNPDKIDVVLQCGNTPGLFMPRNLKSQSDPLIIWNPDGLGWLRTKFPKYGRELIWWSAKRGIKLSSAVSIDSTSLVSYIRPWIADKLVYYLPGGTSIIKESNVDETIVREFGLDLWDYFILVARAAPENHVLEIIKWYAKSVTRKKLVVVCNLSDDKYSMDIREAINSDSRILFKGPIYDKQLLQSLRYYALAYLHGHSVGGTNPSLLESLGAGCPPICFSVPFNREVAGDAGLYFVDEQTLCKALTRIETQASLRSKLSERSISIAKSRYSWDLIVKLHEAVILHSLAFFGRLPRGTYLDWLERCEYYGEFVARGFRDFEKTGVVGSLSFKERDVI